MTEDNRITQIRAVLLDFGQYESGLAPIDVIEKIDEILGDEQPEDHAAEVYEVWDKVARTRAVELVFLDAQAAFAWLAPNVRPDRKGTRMAGDEDMYRVQSVRVWQAIVDRAKAAREQQYDSKGRCFNCRTPGHARADCLKAHDRARAAQEANRDG